ncbi:MAG: lysophospholipid acyltransferase family protein [Methylohalobius sp.]
MREKIVAWPKVGLKSTAVLVWLLGGAGVLIAVFPWLKPAACGRIQQRWFQGLAKILGLRLMVRGRPVGEAALVVSNHISWLDVVVLGAQAPFTFVAKSEVANWPLIGFLARRSGTLFVARASLRAASDLVQAVGAQLKAGKRVVVFPEGTTTCGETVLPFSHAVFQAVSGSGFPIQPVALTYLGQAACFAPFLGEEAFVPHLIRLLGIDRIEVAVFWAAPLPSSERREVLANRTYAAILDGICAFKAGKSNQAAGAF